MTWREDLRRVTLPDGRKLIGASFRGVPFFVEDATLTGGRRVVVHEFPERDEPFVEDLGRSVNKFPTTGYVIGDDYLVQRDALIAALGDTAGPGELVHAYYGARRAICGQYSVNEKTAIGGLATFTFEFIETPAQVPTPSVEADTAGEVDAGADTAVVATKAELADKYNIAGLPAFALASAERAITSAAEGLAATLSPIVTTTQELAVVNGQLTIITAQAASLVRQPADILDAFLTAITGLSDTAEAAPDAMMNALIEAYGIDLGPDAPETTPTRERERANQLALTGALRRVMAIEAARLVPVVPFESIEAATAARDRVAAALEEQAAGAGDTAYPALVNLRSQVLRAVPGGAVFARVVTVTRRVAIPSLLLTYQLYGSVDQEADVLARNQIRHPGFVAGELKVLSNG